MLADLYEVRIARVRHRFATTLENNIESTMVSVDRISRNQGSAIQHVSDSYRHLHRIYGLGATVGFAATGEAAHAAEAALMQAYYEKRGLHRKRGAMPEESAWTTAKRRRRGITLDVSTRRLSLDSPKSQCTGAQVNGRARSVRCQCRKWRGSVANDDAPGITDTTVHGQGRHR